MPGAVPLVGTLERDRLRARSAVGLHRRSVARVGLGLAICSHLVRLMGGTLDLRGTAGQGTVVHAKLPLRLPPGLCPAMASRPADRSGACRVQTSTRRSSR